MPRRAGADERKAGTLQTTRVALRGPVESAVSPP